jgi:hypothetical protein
MCARVRAPPRRPPFPVPSQVNPMFSRVNEKGEILHQSLAVSEVDTELEPTDSGLRETIMRMRDLPTAENWKEIRALFASMCEQVRVLAAAGGAGMRVGAGKSVGVSVSAVFWGGWVNVRMVWE